MGDSTDATILSALKKGVVLYPGSVIPVNPAPPLSSAIHPLICRGRNTLRFFIAWKTQADDLIYITVGGTQYAYRIQTVQKGSAQQLISSGLAGDLIVSTCWPIGTDTNRIAVSANLVR